MKFLNNISNVSKIKRIEFRNDINSLRALSVVSVVFYHAEFSLFKGGWLGVDIFFVISGFLISNIIFSEINENMFSFKNFYLRRVRRIFPALFVILLLTIPFSILLLSNQGLKEFSSSLLSSLFFYSNYFFSNLDFYNSEPSRFMPLLHTWSLAIEEQFYIFFPIIIYLIHKFFKKYILIFIVILFTISLFINIGYDNPDKFYLLQFRAWELILGCIIMILNKTFSDWNFEKFAILIMSFPIFYFDESWINDLEPKLISLFGVSLLLLSNKNNFLNKLSKIKFIRILGLSSFSIYLLHQPVFAFYRIFKYTSFKTSTLIEDGILILTIFFIGYFMYAFVEKKYLDHQYSLKSLTVLFLLILSFAILGQVTDGKYFKTQNVSAYIEEISDLEKNSLYINGKNCHNRPLNNLCSLQNQGSVKVVILGDSTFRSLSKYLAEVSIVNNFDLEIITGSSCIYLVNTLVSDDACPSFELSELDRHVKNIQDSIIIYGGRLPLYLSNDGFDNSIVKEFNNFKLSRNLDLEQEVKNTINFLANKNKIILVYPVPEQGWDVPNLFIENNIYYKSTISYDYILWKNRVKLSNSLLDEIKHKNIYRVYPELLFCNSFIKDKCVGAFEGKIFYSDDNHLSIEGAELLGEIILDYLDNN